MILELKRYEIRLYPETEADLAYLEDTLGFTALYGKEMMSKCIVVRVHQSHLEHKLDHIAIRRE